MGASLARLISLLCLGVLLLVGAGGEAVAQRSDYPRSLWLGAHGGVSLTRFSFVPRVSQDLYSGYGGGLVVRYEVERGANLQVELNYERSGWRESFESDAMGYRRHLTYVEMPILSQLYLSYGIARLNVNAGPMIGYLLEDRGEVRGEGFTEAQELRQSMPVANKIKWGLAGGVGLSLGLARGHRIELDGRVSYSFSDIWSNRRVDPYGQSAELRFGLGISYLIRL